MEIETNMKENEKTKLRYCTHVIKKMLCVIPEDETLAKELKTYYDSLYNIAPECLLGGYYWIIFHNILEKHYDSIPDDKEWKKIIFDIYVGDNNILS